MKQLYKPFLLILVIAFSASSCDLNDAPFNGKPDEQALNTEEGLQLATVGNYALINQTHYVFYFYRTMGEFPGDNVSLSGTTTSSLFNVYTYALTPNQSNTRNLWRGGYKIIQGANQVIKAIGDKSNPTLDQIKGENLYLRALINFQLVINFGRPYDQNPQKNLGIPIITSPDINQLPERATVAEVYNAVIKDLKMAASLMHKQKSDIYASKEVAYALLSRVYLYMGENKFVIEYANKVINSGRYHLLDTEKYKNYFTYLPENNAETIFAIKRTKEGRQNYYNIGSLYLKSPDGVGYGEMYASRSYRNLLDKYPNDARHSFIQAKYKTDDQGNIQKDSNGNPIIEERNGYPIWYVNKYSYQNGIVDLQSPVVLRLAEMYLNRAEAEAKLGQNQKAIDDVNRIRQRTGLRGNELYTTGDLKGHDSVLDVVLEERRLELAFEAQRKYDIFRNNRPLIRDYPGVHLNPTFPGVDIQDSTQIIQPDDPRVVLYIPETEIELNSNLVQNP